MKSYQMEKVTEAFNKKVAVFKKSQNTQVDNKTKEKKCSLGCPGGPLVYLYSTIIICERGDEDE